MNDAGRIAGLILAGGKSSRFGKDKASVALRGRPLLQWAVSALETVCDEIVIVRAEGQELPRVDCAVPVMVVGDAWPGRGPLAGLASGFARATSELCFATSCDAPLLQPPLVRLLQSLAAGYDVACPVTGGYPQPLTAVYRPATCLPVFRDFVERELLKITAAYGPLRVRVVREDEAAIADPGMLSFRNANTPGALAAIADLLDGHDRPGAKPAG